MSSIMRISLGSSGVFLKLLDIFMNRLESIESNTLISLSDKIVDELVVVSFERAGGELLFNLLPRRAPHGGKRNINSSFQRGALFQRDFDQFLSIAITARTTKSQSSDIADFQFGASGRSTCAPWLS